MKTRKYSNPRCTQLKRMTAGLFLAISLAGNAQDSLDEIIQVIDQLIADDQLESARSKLAGARSQKFKDERLDVLESRLNLFDNLEVPSLSTTIDTISVESTETNLATDRAIVTDLLDSLKVALENGELEKVQQLSESSEQTQALLTALFQNYQNVSTRMSELVLDEASQSFFATLEFLELKTFEGDVAYPADNWNLHELRITKTAGEWQKISW